MICPYPISLVNPLVDDTNGFFRMYVGCGRCGACLTNKRIDWTFRIQEEANHSDSVYFITLTYHNSTIPVTDNGLTTLFKPHVQLFNKKLRRLQQRYTDRRFRFFCVGEYGTKTNRPHYHCIYFNLLPIIAEESTILQTWFHGIPHITPLDKGLTHYATKYHVTAQKYDYYFKPEEDDREEEFILSSNKPPEGETLGGIGYQYINRAKDYHIKSLTNYIRNKGHIQRMPNYYYRHIFGDLDSDIKERMRQESEKKVLELEQKELETLIKEGYKYPEQERLRRLVHQAKNARFKAKKKGRF